MNAVSEERLSLRQRVEMVASQIKVHGTKLEALKNEITSIQDAIKKIPPSPKHPGTSSGTVDTLKEMAGRILKSGNSNSGASSTEDSSAKRELRNTTSPTKKILNLRPRVQNGSATGQKIEPKASTSTGPSSTNSSLRLRSLKLAIEVGERSRPRTRTQAPINTRTTTNANANGGKPVVKLAKLTSQELKRNAQRSQQSRHCGYTLRRKRLSSGKPLLAVSKLASKSKGSNNPRRSPRVSNPPVLLQYFGDMRSPLAADGLAADSEAYDEPQEKKRRTRRNASNDKR